MRSLRLGGFAAVLLVLSTASPAFAGSSVRWLGVSLDYLLPSPSRSAVHGHDTRFVVYRERAGELLVRDTRTRAETRIPIGDTCAPLNFQWGNVLLQCGTWGSSDQRVVSIASRAVLTVTGVRPSDEYFVVGRHWLLGSSCPEGPGRYCRTAYLNWHTGERRVEDRDAPPRDLDTERLELSQPRPILPRVQQLRGRVVVDQANGSRLVLGRCRWQYGCGVSQLTADLVVWASSSGRVRAYDLRSRRRYLWRLPSAVNVLATRHEVIFHEPSFSHARRSRLYYARRG